MSGGSCRDLRNLQDSQDVASAFGKLISGKIDRLMISENKVLIIDYKTSQKTIVLEQNYQEQMQIYQQALQKIYPTKEVIYQIIWIN